MCTNNIYYFIIILLLVITGFTVYNATRKCKDMCGTSESYKFNENTLPKTFELGSCSVNNYHLDSYCEEEADKRGYANNKYTCARSRKSSKYICCHESISDEGFIDTCNDNPFNVGDIVLKPVNPLE